MTDKTLSPDYFPTQKEYDERLAALRERILTKRHRNFPPGTVRKCLDCGKRTLAGRDDLVRKVRKGAVVDHHWNLHGARCSSCGAEILEAYQMVLLEEAGSVQFSPDYEARVANVAGKNLGTYWPKDVVRVMGLHAKDSLRVQIVDEDTMVIQREHDHR